MSQATTSVPSAEAPKADAAAAAGAERLTAVLPDKVHTWPHLVRIEMLVATVVMALLTVWSIVVDAPLEEPANPTRTPNPSKAPWYFLGLQEMLVYFDPWFAGVVLPSLIIVGLMLIPYLDVNPKGNGYYCFHDRRFAVSTFLFGFLVLWVGFLLIGTFFRGPGWNFFWPGQPWDPHKVVAITNVDLPAKLGITGRYPAMAFGAACVLGFLVGPPAAYWLARRKQSATLEQLGPIRYWITALLFMTMLGTVVKVVLRLAFDVKYVLPGPLGFNV